MKSFLFAAMPVLALLLLGGVSYYLAHRVHRCLRHFFPKVAMGYVVAFFLLMTAVLVLGFVRSMLPIPPAVRNALGVVNACWMGVFVYLLLFVLLSDALYLILRCFLPLSRFRAYFVLGAVLCALGVSCYGFLHAATPRLVAYDVSLSTEEQAQEMKLVMISDLHLGAVGSESRLEKIVAEINAQQPDVVCITGDFFDNDFHAIRSPEEAAATLKSLRATHGVYLCPGNHDSGGTVPEMLAFWEECGIRLLADESVVIGDRLVLTGRRDPSPIGGFDSQKRMPLEALLAAAPEGLPVIIMDHNPASAASYDSSVSLVLSGHTHKGQIFPGSLITGAMYDVDHGHWQKDEASPHVIVSSGVGTWGPPMRVGTDSEIVVINLHY